MSQELPHDYSVEQAVLASILLKPETALQAASLGPLSFFAERHRIIFRAQASCLGKYQDCDLVLLRRELQEQGKLEQAGGLAYLTGLLDIGATSRSMESYVTILKELEGRREAVTGAAQLAALARSEGTEAVANALRGYSLSLQAKIHKVHRLDISSVFLQEIPEVPWIINHWLGEGDGCIFGGEWATGKSLVALDLCLSVAAGIPWMGMMQPNKFGPVMYVDEENNPVSITRRLKRLAYGRGIDPSIAASLPITYLVANGLRLTTGRGKNLLRQEIENTRPIVLVLDSFVRVSSGTDENSNSKLAEFFSDAITPICRDYNVAVIALDHMRKANPKTDDDTDPADRVRGGGDKLGWADTAWIITGNRDQSTRSLQARKVRWSDSLPGALQTRWNVTTDQQGAFVTASNEERGCEDIIVSMLVRAGDKGVTRAALAEAVQVAGLNVRQATRVLTKIRDRVRKRGEKGHGMRYWLTENAPPSAE